MADDPYGLKRGQDSSKAQSLFEVTWRPDDQLPATAWKLFDSWRPPALELFTRYTPEACFRRMAKVAGEINQDPDDFGFDSMLSGHFGPEYFTLQKTPSLLMESRRLFGGLLSGRIERRSRGLYIRLWHRFRITPMAIVALLVALPFGWIAQDLVLSSQLPIDASMRPIIGWGVFLGVSILIGLGLIIPLLIDGSRWCQKDDADLLTFTRRVLDDDKNFDGWPSLRTSLESSDTPGKTLSQSQR